MPKAPARRINRQPDRRRFNRHERGYGTWWSNPQRTGAADVEFARVIQESGDPWCRICRRQPAELMDHIDAPSNAGDPGTAEYERLLRDMNNLQPACGTCNRIKGNRPMSHPVVRALRGEP